MKRLKSAACFFFSFRGRISRKQWWLGNIALFVFFGVLLRVVLMLLPLFGLDAPFILWFTLWCIPATMLAIKRLHDQGRSGRWLWRVYLLLFGTVFLVAGEVFSRDALRVVPLLLSIWCVCRLGFVAGDVEENQYGLPANAQ